MAIWQRHGRLCTVGAFQPHVFEEIGALPGLSGLVGLAHAVWALVMSYCRWGNERRLGGLCA